MNVSNDSETPVIVPLTSAFLRKRHSLPRQVTLLSEINCLQKFLQSNTQQLMQRDRSAESYSYYTNCCQLCETVVKSQQKHEGLQVLYT
jgi:hypothetical protein